MKHDSVSIMTNYSKTLSTGVTTTIQRRMDEHKHHLVVGFTSKYHLTRFVYFEETCDVYAALAREKQIKGWVRAKKSALIESSNPAWRDLSEEWQGGRPWPMRTRSFAALRMTPIDNLG